MSANEPIPQIPEHAFVVGMTGRLEKTKAPDVFVTMAAEVKKQIPNAFFIMIGDGIIRSTIEQMIADEGLAESFFITGWSPEPYQYLCKLDVGVLLSRWEGFGLAVAEYMAAGKPVVCTRIGGLNDLVIEGHNGFLVNVDDYQAAAQAIIRISQDAHLAQSLGNHGRQRAHKLFNIQRVKSQTEQLFEELVK